MERALTAARKKGGEGAVDAERKRLEARRAADRGRGAKTFYRLTVKDNGVGMAHAAIPDLLGRVLSGTKYGVCQTRGKFGLGAKMALIWSKMSTGLPIEVRSARKGSPTISYYKLDIDIHRNEPAVHAVRLDPNPEPRWRGSELSVTILGDWKYYRSKVKREWRERVERAEKMGEKRSLPAPVEKNPRALISSLSLSLSLILSSDPGLPAPDRSHHAVRPVLLHLHVGRPQGIPGPAFRPPHGHHAALPPGGQAPPGFSGLGAGQAPAGGHGRALHGVLPGPRVLLHL